ncbi:MAG: 1-deoxy-D-xylulose-5-phosphate synthase [Planctomycetota bacterium]|nr:1-deoxy-D-xylulose-5-phosphate synthase [Planctomycetota bacterium]
MLKYLPEIDSPEQLRTMKVGELKKVAEEIREVLCNLLSNRTAHFASNLGVVELCLALHSEFDFLNDRLIWDTGHQIYPQKLITGRYREFDTIRTRGGLMGYPNPQESDYDLFMTGHAGCSVSTALGLRSGDNLMGKTENHSIAVIGDGAFPSGIVYEAMNNAKDMSKFMVILNDNAMSICPRVGALGSYMDRLRSNPFYTGLKTQVADLLNKVPVLGDPMERMLAQVKEAAKAGLNGGMLFEELGFKYIGPVDGHNIAVMKKYFKMVRETQGPVLLHVITSKGHGFEPAASDPVYFHTPPAFETDEQEKVIPKASSGGKAFTNHARDAIQYQMEKNEKVVVLTAAMCQGNKLEPVREKFPDRFFDTGICESHTVAFAGGQAKAGLRPIVDIYSTFLQRSYDQIFQEVCLQNLPVTFMLDRSGLTAADGPTHHGTFDIGYMRIFPNMVVMAPGDANDLGAMLDFALLHDQACSIRYPKDTAPNIKRSLQPVELGKSEVLSKGEQGTIVSFGSHLETCIQAAEELASEGIEVGVINARFCKPLDEETFSATLLESPFVITVEEGMLMGGFGSALLEMANENGINASHVRRLGIPDRFVEHGDRAELLDEIQLSRRGIVDACREMFDLQKNGVSSQQGENSDLHPHQAG